MTFTYRGQTLDYFDHPYNTTVLNERSIEVPVARAFIERQTGRGVEVGNVLGHYGPTSWRVVDRWEEALGVDNDDLFDITGQYDWLVSVSTVEHVGTWPGEPIDPSRAVDAVKHLSTIADLMILTVPFGQNEPLDVAILADSLGADVSTTMVWSEHGWTEHDGPKWGPRRHPSIWPSALWIGEWG